jgi:hypothetical protein
MVLLGVALSYVKQMRDDYAAQGLQAMVNRGPEIVMFHF